MSENHTEQAKKLVQIAREPMQMVPPNELTEEAREIIGKLDELLRVKNYPDLADMIFDIEMEDELSAQIDIEWYTEKCSEENKK